MALIEREAAIALIEEKQKELCPLGKFSRHSIYGSDRDKFDNWQEIIDGLEAIPTIDAAPVVHGRWMFNADMWTWDCTNCKGWVGSGVMVSRYKHCPNCGARMDGGEGHETD